MRYDFSREGDDFCEVGQVLGGGVGHAELLEVGLVDQIVAASEGSSHSISNPIKSK